MAFFIAPSKNFTDALPTQYLGILKQQNNSNLLVIEIDTFQNLELKDINENHIGIDINSVFPVQSNMAGFYEDSSGGAFKNLTLNNGMKLQLWVDYEDEETRINVTLAPLHVGKPLKPLLSATYNLSTVLTETAYIGFSSTAELMNARHYILGWSFGMNGQAPYIDISKLPKLPLVGKRAQSKLLEFVLPIATATFILSVGTLVALVVLRRMKYAEVHEDWEGEFGPHRFSYKDLFHATGGFKNKHLLGEGGFGLVYSGNLEDGSKVAFKVLKREDHHGDREFLSEVEMLSRLHHRNLVKLIGICTELSFRCLVYELIPNGSVESHLHGT
jgi:hypothetical protein